MKENNKQLKERSFMKNFITTIAVKIEDKLVTMSVTIQTSISIKVTSPYFQSEVRRVLVTIFGSLEQIEDPTFLPQARPNVWPKESRESQRYQRHHSNQGLSVSEERKLWRL